MARGNSKTLTVAGIGRLPKAPQGKRVEHYDAQAPGLALRMTDKGTKSWLVYFYLDGKHVKATLGRYTSDPDGIADENGLSLSMARATASEFKRLAALGIDPRKKPEPEPKTTVITFRHVAKEFMQDKGAKFRTAHEVQRKLDKDILPELGNRPIAEITRAEIKEHLRKKARTAPIAANRNLGVIRQVFNFALDEEYIQTSPCVRIAPPGDEVERDRVLTDAELKALWEASKTLPVYGNIVRVLMLTGCRRDEIAEMPAPEIDPEHKMFVIPASRYKTGAEHTVPLSQMALDQFPALPDPTEDVPVPFVFSTSGGERPFSNFSKSKAALVKTSNVTNWWHHDLRRTLETNLARMGFEKEIRDRVLGHTPDGIQRRYNRFDYLNQKRKALDAWADYLEAVIAGRKPVSNVVAING